MSFRDFFARNKEATDVVTSESEITYDTEKLKEEITKWAENNNYSLEELADILSFCGVKLPVKLSEYEYEDDYDEEYCTFKCATVLGTEVRISLVDSDFIVTDGEEERYYNNQIIYKNGKKYTELTLMGKIIKRGGKTLKSNYNRYDWILQLDDTHTLEIYISKPGKNEEQSEIFLLQKCQDIEEYLLRLDESLVVAEVYEKIMKIFDLSNEVSNCEYIWIGYIQTIERKRFTREVISLTYGKMEEYAIRERGETFHVFEDGNWEYLSDSGVRIKYFEKTKKYNLNIEGPEANITSANPSKIINRVKGKISKLWKFVK